jgi:hypothetical protein
MSGLAGRFELDCSNKTSSVALIWTCLCSRGVKTLAPPRGKDFSSTRSKLLGAADLCESSGFPSELLRRLGAGAAEGFALLEELSAFRFMLPDGVEEVEETNAAARCFSVGSDLKNSKLQGKVTCAAPQPCMVGARLFDNFINNRTFLCVQ